MKYHFDSSKKKTLHFPKSGKRFEVNNHICVLNTVIDVVKSHLVAKLILLFGQMMATVFKMS